MKKIKKGIQILPFKVGNNGDCKKFKVNVTDVWKDDGNLMITVSDDEGNTCDCYYNDYEELFKVESGMCEALQNYDYEEKMYKEDPKNFDKNWEAYLNEVTEITKLF